MFHKYNNCIFAAFCATIGGVCAKIGFSNDVNLFQMILFVGISVLANVTQLSIFIKAMHDVGSLNATFLIKAFECAITVC